MILKNIKISTLSYNKRINYAFDLDTLYHIFRRKLGDGISMIRYKGNQLLYKNDACFCVKYKCFRNVLKIKFGRDGIVSISKNQIIKFSQVRNIDLSKIFLEFINEYFTLIPPPKVYKTIKNIMDMDIVNQIIKELTTITYDGNGTKINHIFLSCNYDKWIDFSTLNLPSMMIKTESLHEGFYYDYYRIGNSILYMGKKTASVLLVSNSFTKAENVLAILRQI